MVLGNGFAVADDSTVKAEIAARGGGDIEIERNRDGGVIGNRWQVDGFSDDRISLGRRKFDGEFRAGEIGEIFRIVHDVRDGVKVGAGIDVRRPHFEGGEDGGVGVRPSGTSRVWASFHRSF